MAPLRRTLTLALAVICHAASGGGTGTSGRAVFDFRAFESDVLPKYLPRFKVTGAGIGGYAALPVAVDANAAAGGGGVYGGAARLPTPYGSRAALKALYVVNQLNISGAARDAWATFFDTFQNSSGLWGNYSQTGGQVKDFDTLYLATWEITDAFGLLGRKPRYNNSGFEAVARNRSAWAPTFLPIFNGSQANCSTIHGCGHKVAAIAVVLAATGHRQQLAPFLTWLLQQAEAHLDPTTGEICPPLCSSPEGKHLPECSETLYDCLGGGMTYHSMLTYLGKDWPGAGAVQQLALTLQKPDGLWSTMSDSMNFDGIYQLSRPCRQHRCTAAVMGKIEAACTKYVATALATLSSPAAIQAVFDPDFHHFPVCLATIAECQSWFPKMVLTHRPWRTQTFP